MNVGGNSYQGDTVLCRGLYDKLWAMSSGRVSIANEGEPFRATSQRSLRGMVRLNVTDAGEYYRVACPFCQDTRQRLWVNHMFGQQGQDGWPMKFLAICYNERCLDKAENRNKLYEWIYGFRNVNERETTKFAIRESDSDDLSPIQEASPPGLVLPLTDLHASNPHHPAVNYMLYERGYSLQMLEQWGIGYCSSASHRFLTANNRIIFPIWFNRQYVGWQARFIGELDDWGGVPKYYTMPGLKKRKILYNFDRAVQMSCGVIVEGLTDVHNVGAAGMATLGASISVMQAQLLAMNFSGKPIILLYDPEAVDETATAMSRLMQFCPRSPVVDVLLPPNTDPGSTQHDLIWQHIITQAAARGVRVQQCDRF